MPIRAILIDHDGTLVDSEPSHFRMWATVLARYGVQLSEEVYAAHYAGVPTPSSATDMVGRFGLQVDPRVLTDAKRAATQQYLERGAFPLMPNATRTIIELRGLGLQLAIVTGARADSVYATLRENHLERYFSTVVSGADVQASKPAPDCYLLTLKRLGLKPDECVAIEDTQHGMKAALSAGVRCLALPTAFSAHHDFEGADAVLDGMSHALRHVQHVLLERRPSIN